MTQGLNQFTSTLAHVFNRFAARLGIASRLALAFVAVVVLATAANFMAVEGELLVVRTEVPVLVHVPAVTSPPVPAPIPAATPEPAPVNDPFEARRNDFTLALDRYDSAVLSRLQTSDATATSQLQAAEKELSAAAQALASLGTSSSSRRALGPQPINRSMEHAQRLITLTDLHRESVAKYSSHVESMNDRVQAAVDRAWKVFGRVVARQSLIKLSTDLDQLRKHFSALQGAGSSSPAELVPLAESEATLRSTLADNSASLARSQGNEWLAAMQLDHQGLEQTRRTIATTDLQWRDQKAQFSSSVLALRSAASTLAAKSATPVAPAVVPVTAPATTVIEPAPEQQTTTTVAPASSETPATSDRTARRTVMVWLTAAVLAILIVICVTTVFSITRPVNALLAAIARLGKAGVAGEVPRGGIKELDAVASAFNTMSRELSASQQAMREYQELLEARVEERTRQLKDLAERDALTSLPNRRQLFAVLDDTLRQAAACRGTIGVLFLDLDNFKNFNDSMGHAFGDKILIRVAERLAGLTRDVGFAARLGGDEFTVVLTRVNSPEDVRRIGTVICRAFQDALVVDEREFVIGVSIGASIYPHDDQTSAGLLTAADAALFRAKALGRGQLASFSPDLLAVAATKFQTEQSLRRAIERGEFELLFQPELNVQRLEVSLVEALLRWRAPNGQLVSPAEFLCVAEESGLIGEIGDWVLRAAIATAADWHHGAWPDAKVAINVSPRQLLDARFVDRVRELLDASRLPPRCIEIELTEDVLQTGPATLNTLRRLRALGVSVALDDFGTGYSSLASLERLPLTRIKLDRSLTAGLLTSRRSAAITRAIIAMCHELGLSITAEGVESSAQFAALATCRDMNLQGFLLSRPVPASEVPAALKACAQYGQLLSMSSSTEPLAAHG